MKKVFLVFLLFPLVLTANTYFNFIVDGVEANTMVQGQTFAWEIDVVEPGNKVQIQLFEDVNSNQILDDGDKLLDFFYITDGENDPEEGVGDSDETANGVILSDFGVFGFITGDFVFKAVDEDGSFSTNHFNSQLIENENVTQVIKGHIILNDVIPPDPSYAGVVFGVMSDNGIWMTQTENNGEFWLRLPYSVDMGVFTLMMDYSGPKEYISDFDGIFLQIGGVDTFTIAEGVIAERCNARVYGTLFDGSTEAALGKYVGVEVGEAFNHDTEKDWYADPQGNYEIYTMIDQSMEMYVNLDDDDIVPEYMMLAYWFQGSPYRFTLAPDQYDKNVHITVYPADTNVVIDLERDIGEVDSFLFSASSTEIFSISREYTNAEGNAFIPVYSGIENYWTVLDEWETPIPEGWIIEPEYGQNTPVGGTAYFYMFYPDAINVDENLISSYRLMQNYPNPFNPSTIIKYNLPVSSEVEISVYNSLGQRITTLVNKWQTIGQHQVEWSGQGYPSGIYYYRLTVGNYTLVKKMVLMR